MVQEHHDDHVVKEERHEAHRRNPAAKKRSVLAPCWTPLADVLEEIGLDASLEQAAENYLLCNTNYDEEGLTKYRNNGQVLVEQSVVEESKSLLRSVRKFLIDALEAEQQDAGHAGTDESASDEGEEDED